MMFIANILVWKRRFSSADHSILILFAKSQLLTLSQGQKGEKLKNGIMISLTTTICFWKLLLWLIVWYWENYLSLAAQLYYTGLPNPEGRVKAWGQSPSGRQFELQQGHWRHYKPAASPGPRGTNRGAPVLKQRDPVGTASRVRKAIPENHGKKKEKGLPVSWDLFWVVTSKAFHYSFFDNHLYTVNM